MSIKYSNNNSYGRSNSLVFIWTDPFAYKRATENEMRFEYRSSKDPEQAPRPERGDKYITIGAVVGILIGCTTGAIIGNRLIGIGGVFLGLAGGAIVGGIIGVTIGSYIKKRTNKRPRKRAETDEQGPFIR